MQGHFGAGLNIMELGLLTTNTGRYSLNNQNNTLLSCLMRYNYNAREDAIDETYLYWFWMFTNLIIYYFSSFERSFVSKVKDECLL
jgi:hypothetical protein